MAWPAPDATRPIWKTRPPEATAIQVTDSNTVPGADPVGAGNVIVDVRDAHYSVGGREIFSGLSLQALKGQITAVMGPSGTGKTTLLRLITAQRYAERGEVKGFG